MARKTVWLLILAIIVVIAGVVAGLELTNTTFWFHARPETTATTKTTAGPITKGDKAPAGAVTKPETIAPNNSAPGNQNPPASDDKNNNPSADQTDKFLLAPNGPFVSNHKPNLSGQPLPNTENSACSTTSGATCQIIFTKGDITKKLPAQMTDAGGSTYWNGWTLQSVGLTEGSWKITAVAKLGSQTKTASDAMTLDVAP